MIGWVILAIATTVLVTAALVTFWDEIKEWLNNNAADAVERMLGYEARQRMYRAIARIDKVMGTIKNRTVVYTKKDKLDAQFLKTTMETDIYEIDRKVLEAIDRENGLEQSFEYKV